MKLTTPLALLALISGGHSLIIKRDLPVAWVLTDVLNRTIELDYAVGNFTNKFKPVADGADNLIKSIDNAQRVANNTPLRMSHYEVTQIIAPFRLLQGKAEDLFDTFEDRKEDVEKAKACGITHKKLGIIGETISKMMRTVTNKVKFPWPLFVVKRHAKNIRKLLADTQSLFSETNCIDG
ncbi:hydrophobic surface binding protein A domain-containing protein [Pochonia chlamydosporia 170]|uniref:Hydrophobic surface binding protein A domain-containing protein n=1 Tax=Pochonia chlamydosporia 170 TaxID=1380566 RepID=A0A179FRM7_METCM|nr:hydrophobic surface binding protein A domain-containing protein [Pochonia chlamydosporia 170]OAQ67908.1 hydrophobic surface binding protein A domain-containing protein [Pochonia chlamydosporia 170]